MNNDLSSTEKKFIDRMGKISKRWGVGEPVGRVWGALLFAGVPLSQKEIAEKTGYTLSLVSPSLNLMEKLDMARSLRSNNKEKLYETTTSFIDGFRRLIKNFLDQDIKPLIEELENTKGINNNPNLSKLVSEYKIIKQNLDRFEKMRFDCEVKK
jgi:DNA-binding transcriptional regulator GbsR (MarR family)